MNNPLAWTDASGLAADHEGAFYGDWGKGLTRVKVDVNAPVKRDGDPGWIAIGLDQSLDLAPVKFQFIQMGYHLRKDATTHKWVGGGSLHLKNGRYLTYADSYPNYSGPARFADVASVDVAPFYTETTTQRVATRRWTNLWDNPDLDITDIKVHKLDDFEELRDVFDVFVVGGDKVYYHVHWEKAKYKDGDSWSADKYEKISGEPVMEHAEQIAGALLGVRNPLAAAAAQAVVTEMPAGGSIPPEYFDEDKKLRLGFFDKDLKKPVPSVAFPVKK
jgi:hypothetical protein